MTFNWSNPSKLAVTRFRGKPLHGGSLLDLGIPVEPPDLARRSSVGTHVELHARLQERDTPHDCGHNCSAQRPFAVLLQRDSHRLVYPRHACGRTYIWYM